MEHYLYLIIDLTTLAVPLIASFYPKHAYYKTWRFLFPAIAAVALFFVFWDVLFTSMGIWGFNERYVTGLKIFNLPLEEVLFFICIPYSSVFVYFSFLYLQKKTVLQRTHRYITLLLILMSSVLLVQYYDRWYTASTFGLLLIYLAYHLYQKTDLSRYYVSYTITLVFFFIVNGILTGSWIEEPVVWYNNSENLGIRIGTIPFEDAFYGFLLIALVIDIYRYLQHKK